MVLWVIFRSSNFSSALNMLLGLIGTTGVYLPHSLERFLHGPLQFLHVPGVVFTDAFIVDLDGNPFRRSKAILFFFTAAVAIAFGSPNSQELIAKLEAIRAGHLSGNAMLYAAWGLIMGLLFCILLLIVVHKSEFLYFQF